jgi:hypothetical protein
MSQDKQQVESGRKPKEEGRAAEPAEGKSGDQSSLPLFLRDTSEGNRGNTQDEKDEVGE